jgi:uncharacterized protein
MKITLDIKTERLNEFFKWLKRKDFLTPEGIRELEAIEVSEPLVSYGGLAEKRNRTIEAQEIFRTIKEYFSQTSYPVEKVWVFGSFARNEQTGESDIDLMIRFHQGSKIDLWDFTGIMQDLEDILGIEVDLVREGGAKPFAIAGIENDKILIYERETERQGTAGTHTFGKLIMKQFGIQRRTNSTT